MFVCLYNYRTIAFEPICQPTPTKEEEEIPDGLHQPPDLRTGEAIPLPKIPVAIGSGRDRGGPRFIQCSGRLALFLKQFEVFEKLEPDFLLKGFVGTPVEQLAA